MVSVNSPPGSPLFFEAIPLKSSVAPMGYILLSLKELYIVEELAPLVCIDCSKNFASLILKNWKRLPKVSCSMNFMFFVMM